MTYTNKNIFFFGFLTGVLLFLFIALPFHSRFFQKTEDCRSEYKFINPEPGCEISEKQLLESMNSLQLNVENQITILNSEKKADKVSVYFRGLLSKRWFGINEKENYSGGSLFKLPVAVAYYKLAEFDPSVLSKKIEYKVGNSFNDLLNIKPTKLLEDGKLYSVYELIERMLIYSDNDAAYLLTNMLDKRFLEKVFLDLDIYFPEEDEGMYRDLVTAQIYTSILRSLYNASYLDRESADELLEILSHVEFKDGLVAGIPKDVTISHKFGEHVRENSYSPSTLHDCGIIYKKDRPYILCVMTTGEKLDDLKTVIRDISKIVYDGVNW